MREYSPTSSYHYLDRDNIRKGSDAESLIFETRMEDKNGENVTLGAVGIVAEEAAKLSWKNFRHYLVRDDSRIVRLKRGMVSIKTVKNYNSLW